MTDSWLMNHETDIEKMLNRFTLPDVVHVTKATENGPLCYGKDRSIHHSHWGVESHIGRHRTRLAWFSFDNVVASGGVRMNAPHLRSDYLVKKILILVGLGAGESRMFSVKALQVRGQFYDRLVRWRLSLGIERNDLLRKEHYDAYLETLKGNSLGALPISERLDHLLSDLYSGKRTIDEFYKPAEKNKKQLFNWDHLADLLGTTKFALSTSKPFVIDLADRLSSLEHPLTERIVNSIIRTDDGETRDDYSESHVTKLLNLWRLIHRLTGSGLLPVGGLSFNPFEKLTLKQTVRSLNPRPIERTGTLAPEDFIRLLQTACKWAFEYGEYILEAAETRRGFKHKYWAVHKKNFTSHFDKIRPEGAPKLHHGWTISVFDTESKSDRISLGDAVKHLMTACAIIIASFSARRGGEISMLMSDCISQVGALYYLNVHILKTLQRTEIVPVPQMVVAAVDILKAASGESGASDEPSPLFHVMRQDSPLYFEFTANLKAFAAYNEIPPPEGETEWNFSSHQLRRGAAIYYYYGNDWGQLDNVAHLLRHFDPEMTRIYLTEAISGAIGQLEDELRARSEVVKINKNKELKAWIAGIEEELSNLRGMKAEFDEVRVEAYAYRMLAKGKHGLDEAIGHGVKRLKMNREAMIEAAAADIRIKSGANDEETYQEALYVRAKRQAANQFLEPVPEGVAHCTANLNGGDDLSLGECNKLAAAGRSPWKSDQPEGRNAKVDLAFSGAYPCLTCIYGVMFRSNQRVIKEKMAAVKATIETAPHEVAASARQAQFDEMMAAYEAAEMAAKRA